MTAPFFVFSWVRLLAPCCTSQGKPKAKAKARSQSAGKEVKLSEVTKSLSAVRPSA